MQVVPEFANRLIPHVVSDPDELFCLPGCEVIKDQRKIKVARVRIEIQGDAKTVYIKRYNAFSWRYRVGSWFQSSGASRSLKGAAILAESGIRTADCLAAMETRSWGMLQRSFFLSAEIPEGKTADVYWREALLAMKGRAGARLRRRFLRDLGVLFDSLHQQGLYHNDLKDANIVVSPDPEGQGHHFYLLDLEGIRRYRKLNRRRRIKNLVQLHRTLGRYLRRPDKLQLLKGYLGPLFAHKTTKRGWVLAVLRQSEWLDGLQARKHPSAGMATNAAQES
jgi:hypothetical protein